MAENGSLSCAIGKLPIRTCNGFGTYSKKRIRFKKEQSPIKLVFNNIFVLGGNKLGK